jgi:hypothetical protein
VNDYQIGDTRWDGGVNKGLIEIHPGETEHFRLWVTTPDFREYWGSDLEITLKSESGGSESIPLHKPPIPILITSIPSFATFEDIISFTGSQSLYNIVDYYWDFGDGNNGTNSSVTHSFGRSGEYVVTLTVTDDGNFTASKSILIEIENMDPIAVIQVKPQNRTVEVGQPVRLDASFSRDRDGMIVNYLWEFGELGSFFDGFVPIIEYIYKDTGTFTITLYVTDNSGDITNVSVDVNVIPRPEDPEKPTEPVIEEETTIDPLSYIPAALVVLVILAGVIFIIKKKVFINYIIKKIYRQSGNK